MTDQVPGIQLYPPLPEIFCGKVPRHNKYSTLPCLLRLPHTAAGEQAVANWLPTPHILREGLHARLSDRHLLDLLTWANILPEICGEVIAKVIFRTSPIFPCFQAVFTQLGLI
jgi:hypothetical protein